MHVAVEEVAPFLSFSVSRQKSFVSPHLARRPLLAKLLALGGRGSFRPGSGLANENDHFGYEAVTDLFPSYGRIKCWFASCRSTLFRLFLLVYGTQTAWKGPPFILTTKGKWWFACFCLDNVAARTVGLVVAGTAPLPRVNLK